MKALNLKISSVNESDINDAIAAEEGSRARVRRLNYDDIVSMVNSAEKALRAAGLPMSLWPGARYCYSEGGLMGAPSCYKGFYRASSEAVIERRSRHWYLISFSRPNWYKDESGPDYLLVTPTQRDEMVRRFARSIKFYKPLLSVKEKRTDGGGALLSCVMTAGEDVLSCPPVAA